MNKVILVGRLGSDPELKTVGNNQTVARLAVATSESWTGKDGQKQERTEWHRIVVWGKLAEICGKYLAKGRQVLIEGKIQTRSWEDNGTKKYATEIVASTVQFLGSNNSGEASGGSSDGQKQKKTSNQSTKKAAPAKEDADASDFSDSDFNFSDFGPEPSGTGSEDSGSGDIPF